ncbi:MAG: lytic transglycosylase domain-containing protein [Alphaproteobacteria bacterium]|nr:MAG: lytic transglycosylase domain-containing protein [Alphaproteobacteria bacterium]
MKHYTRLRCVTLCGIIGVFALIQSISPRVDHSITRTPYAHYAQDTSPPPPLAPTDAVPFPVCRAGYIDLSEDASYPVPHWVYSLPKVADKALILAIIKNESRFRPSVRSHKGAVGLMQLMPETADVMVRKLGAKVHLASMQADKQSVFMPRSAFDFQDPYVSLAVGYRYISYLQSKPYVGDNIVYMLAAYNAGPVALLKWKKELGALSQAQFARSIPYKETREYVQNVLRDYAYYQSIIPDIHDTVWVEGETCS